MSVSCCICIEHWSDNLVLDWNEPSGCRSATSSCGLGKYEKLQFRYITEADFNVSWTTATSNQQKANFVNIADRTMCLHHKTVKQDFPNGTITVYQPTPAIAISEAWEYWQGSHTQLVFLPFSLVFCECLVKTYVSDFADTLKCIYDHNK